MAGWHGSDERGPGGNPSWLGGQDRGTPQPAPHGAEGTGRITPRDGWSDSGADARGSRSGDSSSDFSSDFSADFAPTSGIGDDAFATPPTESVEPQAEDPRFTGPRFGVDRRSERRPSGSARRSKATSSGQSDPAIRLAQKLFVSVLSMVILVVVSLGAIKSGREFGWLIMVGLVVIVPQAVKHVQRYLKNR